MPPENPPQTDDRPRLEGFLIIDKPEGISSMQAVATVRRRGGRVKTGHAGTLDPLATGVLVLALGKATKCIIEMMDTSKRYRTEIDLSAFTGTDDREGEREEIACETPPDKAAIRQALTGFKGSIMQRPPAFSAVKIDGKRAYKMARKGEDVEIPARSALVYEIDLVSFDWPLVVLDIHCAKGFYVRSLARDLGLSLGAGGHCISIRRNAVGPFTIEDSMRLADVPEPLEPGHLLSIDAALEMVRRQKAPRSDPPLTP